jgi:4-alpha-glucanotransferase
MRAMVSLINCTSFISPITTRSKTRSDFTIGNVMKNRASGVDAPVDCGYDEKFPQRKERRRAGIIMHPTSLPGPYGIGDMGPEAYAFIDWLSQAKMQIWQILPLVPPGRPVPGIRENYWSPYSGSDANCGNSLMLSLDFLVRDGLLNTSELPTQSLNKEVKNVDFQAIANINEPLIKKAVRALFERPESDSLQQELKRFCYREDVKVWLDHAALFHAISEIPEYRGKDWWDWPFELREREESVMLQISDDYRMQIEEFKITQFLWQKQWLDLKYYANERGISILGDMPIYVGGHSADVWANKNLFQLDINCKPTAVAGTPPDAFSSDGQLWGNPLYSWVAHEEDSFSWWNSRMKRCLELHDEVRIDHFRAFSAYWSVDADAQTARDGKWRNGPGLRFFQTLNSNFDSLPIVAEDLGVITEDVNNLRKSIGAPGMVVLQFAWGSDGYNPHLPHNYDENSFCYPGTHDNETSQGWYDSQDAVIKRKLKAYANITADSGAWGLIKCAMSSVSKSCIFTMQDVLSLGNEARMNTPGIADGNWSWRIGSPGFFKTIDKESAKLADLALLYNRVNNGGDEKL